MKKIFNLAIIILIFGFIYLPMFSSSASAASVFDIFNKWFSGSKSKSQVISSPSFDLPAISEKEINIQNNNKTTSGYLNTITEIWENTSFNEDDFKKIKRNKDGRILSVEELAKYAETVGISNNIKESLKIWQKLDQQVIDKLREVPINRKYLNTHKSVLRWYKYHAEYAGKIAEDDISQEKIKKINGDYFKNAQSYVPKMHRQISETDDTRSFLSKILINSAYAILYPFGGMVTTWTDVDCIQGIPLMIAGIKGGWFFLYYATWTANPYLYKAIHPGTYMLGYSFAGAGICSKATTAGMVSYPAGTFTIIYFGSNL